MKKVRPIVQIIGAAISVLLFCVISCAPRGEKTHPLQTQENSSNAEPQAPEPPLRWYYFHEKGFAETDSPANVRETEFFPWTEQLRVSSFGTQMQGNVDTAYFLANRLGLLVFSEGQLAFVPNAQFFHEKTADSLVFIDSVPVFHLYRNVFFNKSASVPDAAAFASYSAKTGLFYPLIQKSSVGASSVGEITDVALKNGMWYCTVKESVDDKTTFDYVRFAAREMNPLSPTEQNANIAISSITAEQFRAAKQPYPFEQAPAQLKLLLESFPADFSFSVECAEKNIPAARLYRQNNDEESVKGFAMLSTTVDATVFEDGTCYISREQNIDAFQLPQLPDGFMYGRCVVSGRKLYAAWEEVSFYQIGRSGFVEINLDAVLGGK